MSEFEPFEPTQKGFAHQADLSSTHFSLGFSHDDILKIRKAHIFCHKVFDEERRSWGPDEKLPLTSHATEVGTLLLLAEAPVETVIAGYLHDAFEGYVTVDQNRLRDAIRQEFGERVLALIDAVTEPAKSSASGNWLERKLQVLNNVKAGDSEVAAICCAAKISTLSAANKYLRMGEPVESWSAGSYEENMAMFSQLEEVFFSKNISQILLKQFVHELDIFEALGKANS